MPVSTRLTAAASAALLSTLVMTSSGCLSFATLKMHQEDLLGPGVLTIGACVSKENSSCPSGGASDLFPTPTPGTRFQVLVGVMVPSGYTLPNAVVRPPAPPTYPDWFGTWTKSASLAEELTALIPPPDGREWVGYISEATDTFAPGEKYSARLDLARPVAADGTPLPASVQIRVSLGVRSVTDAAPADRPVVCNVQNFTICKDTEAFDTFRLHDLSILPPPPVTAARGTTAVIPVTALFVGDADPKYTFALTATTTLPGASATANVPTLTPPTDSTTGMSVSVPIPQNAAPGTYAVTVTAKLGSTGESRSATGTLIVPAPGAPGTGTPPGSTPSGGVKPAVVLTTRGVTARAARTTGLPVRVFSDTATRATVSLTQIRRLRIARRVVSRAVVIARRTVSVKNGTTTLRVKSARLLAGPVTVRITGPGFSARTRTVLR